MLGGVSTTHKKTAGAACGKKPMSSHWVSALKVWVYVILERTYTSLCKLFLAEVGPHYAAMISTFSPFKRTGHTGT